MFKNSYHNLKYIFKPDKKTDSPRLAKILDSAYFIKRDQVLDVCLRKLQGGASLNTAVLGFNALEYDERIIEYSFFVDWTLKNRNTKNDFLDIGCTLNHSSMDFVFNNYYRNVYFCNPAIEPLKIKSPSFYHLSKLQNAFPNQETFETLTCLSTIEHIGFDNSQYGSNETPIYKEPTLEPLQNSLSKIIKLTKPGGTFIISVPYGFREALIHPVTHKIASQVFDYDAISKAIENTSQPHLDIQFRVFESSEKGWHLVDAPEKCTRRYAQNCPAAGAVAFLIANKTQ